MSRESDSGQARERDRLEEKLAVLDQEIDDFSSRWNIRLGPVRLSKKVYT
jgi:hypothetical protein